MYVGVGNANNANNVGNANNVNGLAGSNTLKKKLPETLPFLPAEHKLFQGL